MSAHMKKRLTKTGQLIFRFDSKTYTYNDISKEKVDAILSIINSKREEGEYVDADQLSKEKIACMKGKESYKRAAYFLKIARKNSGLNQVDLAKKINITQSNLSSMENARRAIGKSLAKRLAEVFNVNYKVFLSD